MKRWNLNFQQEKNNWYWLLWGIFKEYIKQNIVMAVLRKANAHLVVICRLIKKSTMQTKKDPRRKTDSDFDFYQDA